MSPTVQPRCEWLEIEPDDVHVAFCPNLATDVFGASDGTRHFACAEHLSDIRARSANARGLHWVFGLIRTARPTPDE